MGISMGMNGMGMNGVGMNGGSGIGSGMNIGSGGMQGESNGSFPPANSTGSFLISSSILITSLVMTLIFLGSRRSPLDGDSTSRSTKSGGPKK